MQVWTQNYNPLGNAALSTAVAALPVTLLFYLLAVRKMHAHWASVWSFVSALVIAVAVFGMPAPMVAASVGHGFVYAVIRIAWTLLAAVFVYEITVESGHFETIKSSIGAITDDRRLQMVLVAFAFGAVMEGAGGGGAPVAICGAMMVGLGFPPFQSAVLCLIANTAPVAFGGMGNPIRTLVAVTALPEPDLSATVARILAPMSLILPFWLVRSMVSWGETMRVWPGLLATGLVFGAIKLFWATYIDGTLVDIMAGMVTLLVCAIFFKVWKPKPIWRYPNEAATQKAHKSSHAEVLHAWSPFLLIAVFVVVWGLPACKKMLNTTSLQVEVPGLHNLVLRTPPVVGKEHTEPAVMDVAWLSAVGTATFIAGLIAGPLLGLTLRRTLKVFGKTVHRLRFSFVAIFCMICLGYVTRYSGMDAVMGLALTHTGWWYPLFGTLIGWMGVALTGTDAGSNALFGSLQVITANGLGLSPVLMAAANSAGGVMGKMIDAQSLIVGCVACGIEGQEGNLFRAVIKHSIALAVLVGLTVMLIAYVFPWLVTSGHKYW
jgi:lactate permease